MAEQRYSSDSHDVKAAGSEHETPLRGGVLCVSFGVKTDVGVVRGENEDAFEIIVPDPSDPLAKRGSLFVVADGMGGHAAGALASHTAVNTVSETFYSGDEAQPVDLLLAAVRAAHERVLEVAASLPERRGMGCTVVAAALGTGLTVVNIGDSRAYLLRKAALEQVTEDHSLVAAQVRAGLMSQEAARESPFRSALTQCVGVESGIAPDVFTRDILTGDVILLCSDGLHEPLGADRIQAILEGNVSPSKAAKALVKEAIEAGSRDNVTAICISVTDRSDD